MKNFCALITFTHIEGVFRSAFYLDTGLIISLGGFD